MPEKTHVFFCVLTENRSREIQKGLAFILILPVSIIKEIV